MRSEIDEIDVQMLDEGRMVQSIALRLGHDMDDSFNVGCSVIIKVEPGRASGIVHEEREGASIPMTTDYAAGEEVHVQWDSTRDFAGDIADKIQGEQEQFGREVQRHGRNDGMGIKRGERACVASN